MLWLSLRRMPPCFLFLPSLLPRTFCIKYYWLPIKHLSSLLPCFLPLFFFLPSFLPSFIPCFLPSFPTSFLPSFLDLFFLMQTYFFDAKWVFFGAWLFAEVFQGLRHEALVLAEVPASLAKRVVPHFERACYLRPGFSSLGHVYAPWLEVFVEKSINLCW